MTIASGEVVTGPPTLIAYVERSIEALWLITAALVPLIFVPTDYMLSEAVNAYVEVPKTTAFRALVGLMAILWIVEWLLKGGLTRRYTLSGYLTGLGNWVVAQPSRWVVIAACAYAVVAIITTLTSTSLWISMWGEVSGQFGYSAYTLVSYFLLFAVIVTHLKTSDQLWRLLGVMVATGALVTVYAIVQHYGGDPLDLGEGGTARVSATMANPVFAGAALVTTSLLTLGVGLLVLNQLGWSAIRGTLWIALIAAQFMAVFWTGARGSWLLGVPVGLVAFLALATFTFGMRGLTRTALLIVSALLIAFAVVALTPTGGESDDNTTGTAGQIQDRVGSIKSDISGRGLSFRKEIWEGAMGLIARRPWFAFEDLSLSFIRPLVGYGPELFKYTFPLESPLGGLLSQSHNFFLHHWVEQGILGLFSSLGLFIAFFLVGAAQLWRNRATYSAAHKWILVALGATMLGRVAEMMVGVARESDLVHVWIMLAIFVVLPSVMSTTQEPKPSIVRERETLLSRRQRRRDRQGRRERRARGAGEGFWSGIGPVRAAGFTLVAALIVFIGWLSWDKNIDYAWAAALAASAQDRFREGDIQETHRLMSKASAKAPDVPSYYNQLGAIYDAYRQAASRNPEEAPSCEDIFSLGPRDPRIDPPQGAQPFARCAAEAYLSNLRGFEKNTTSPQAKLSLANSTLNLAALGYEGKDEEAIRWYSELVQMIPSSWPLKNALGSAYIRLSRPREALAPLDRSLSITKDSADSSQALFLKGQALQLLDDNERAIELFEQSLELTTNPRDQQTLRSRLERAYNDLAVDRLNKNQPVEALESLERYLSITTGSASAGVPLYLQGIAYQQLDELETAVDVLQQSLLVDENGPQAADARRILAEVVAALGEDARTEEP